MRVFMKSLDQFRCNRLLRVLALAVVFLISRYALAQEVPEPSDYRMDDYDAPVPAGLAGAIRVTAVDVKRMQDEGNVLVVDVIPEHRKPDVLPEGQIWFPVDHKGLPGALWLPDTGFGLMSEVTENYFKGHLLRATAGKLDTPLVFYCRTDCWMSWNAARRALSYGYTSVHWFADGVDDWFFEGYEFAILKPAAGQRQASVK